MESSSSIGHLEQTLPRKRCFYDSRQITQTGMIYLLAIDRLRSHLSYYLSSYIQGCSLKAALFLTVAIYFIQTKSKNLGFSQTFIRSEICKGFQTNSRLQTSTRPAMAWVCQNFRHTTFRFSFMKCLLYLDYTQVGITSYKFTVWIS